jgi:hypothetical protein
MLTSPGRVRTLLLRGLAGCAVVLLLLPGCRHAGRRARDAAVQVPPAPVFVGPVDEEYLAGARPMPEVPEAPEPEAPVLPEPASPPPASAGPEVRSSAHGDLFGAIREELARQRCAVEPGSEPTRGHAPDFSWLVGELQYLEVRNAWRLRYASVEDEDRYGGSVTLVEMGSLTGLRNGQRVRVEGRLVDPESRDPSPAYRVRSLQFVK